jgi:hypothetical protein
MLRAVAFDEMPRKPAVLPYDRRRAIVHELIATLYPDEPSRDIARRIFEDSTRWRSPLSEPARLAAVHAHSGVPKAEWAALNYAFYGNNRPFQVIKSAGYPLSPTMTIDLATAALADCMRLGEVDRSACLDRAMRIDEVLTDDAE